VNDELERMWMEAVVATFKVLSLYFSRQNVENRENCQNRRPT
jgi:hypothetical protein